MNGLLRVREVSATLKLSKEMPGGAWKSLELSAKADVPFGVNAQTASAALYGELAQAFRVLWKNNLNQLISKALQLGSTF